MTSMKKLIAVLAVSLPLAATAQQAAPPAAAAAPLYQIYGTLNVNLQYVEVGNPFSTSTVTGQNAPGRFGVSIDSTNIGIRGTADTGQFGLSVVYQCETQATLDGTGTNSLCNRNSRLGFSHEYGTLFLGNWDTPLKAIWYGTKGDDAFGNTDIFDAAGLMGSPGFRTKSGAAPLSFNVRAANSVVYHSPKFMGAQVKAQWSTDENKTSDAAATNTGGIAPAAYSVGLNYDRGPLSVFAAWERHDDTGGLNAIATGAGATAPAATVSEVDTGIRVGAGYELGSGFGTTTFGAVYEYLDYDMVNTPTGGTAPVAAGTLINWNRSAIMGNVKHRMGNHEFRARYTYADNGDCKLQGTAAGVTATCNADIGRGASSYAIGYGYYLSKAAQVYAFYTKIENERNASYTFATQGPATLTAGWSNGADPAGGGAGIRYAF